MDKQKIVRRTEEITEAVGDMNRAMANVQATKAERQLNIDEFKKKFPDAIYLEPAVRIPTSGVRHPEMEKQRDYLHEYVVGIFESQLIQGHLDFFLTGLPGDDYCRWKIPVNKPIGIPRFVAQHLAKNLSWKEMKPMGRGNEPQAYYEEEMMNPFTNFETKRRGTFHPINAY